jgi:glycosyltransferase involved in cell wall biosynthesis
VVVLAPHAKGVAADWSDGGVEVRSFRYAPVGCEVLGYSRSLASDERVRLAAAAVAPLYLLGARRAVRRALAGAKFDLLHAHWVVPNGLAVIPFHTRVPLAVGLHGSDVFQAEKPGVRRWVGRALARSSLVTGCSPELVDRVCALGFDRRAAHVIPYGVDPESFSPRAERRSLWRERLGIPEDAPLLLSVGRMVTKKGYQVLIEALPDLLAAHPSAHLVLGGTGDRLEEFRRAVEPWTGRVHLPGIVLRDTLPDLYRAADVFVLPAVHDAKGNVDGLPNVILEAMASALPVVASGISGIPLAVEDGVHGRLVPEADAVALGTALDALLSAPERAREMGQAGRLRVERSLTWRAIAVRYREAYAAALDGVRREPAP